jgi:hypothetical protein
MDCTLQALHHLTGQPIDELKKEFNGGKKHLPDGTTQPPGVHRIIDYLMSIGCSLTPIVRCTESTHGRLVVKDYTGRQEINRWATYLTLYEGLLVGTRNGVGHMVFVRDRKVYDGTLVYDWTECDEYEFTPTTFMVATWQA